MKPTELDKLIGESYCDGCSGGGPLPRDNWNPCDAFRQEKEKWKKMFEEDGEEVNAYK